MKEKNVRKREGFEGQRMVVLPKKIISTFLTTDKITRQCYITDIGYYPKAKFHYAQRVSGIDQHILIYCVEGKGWIEINKKKIEILPSQLITIPAHTPHRYGANEEDPWSIYWIHFKGEIADYIVELMLEQSKIKTYLAYNENRIQLFEEIYTNLAKGYSLDNLRFVNMTFFHFLSSLLYEDQFNSSINQKDVDGVNLIVDLMQKSIHTRLSLREFASAANLSIAQFSTIFRKKTGHSPIEYFNHLKIQKACQYLLFTNLAVKEISNQLGIDDQYYFSRMFSKLMGLSPSNYRKKNKT
jgi:AraC-like DNA-binding protein/mannose-6-phosphate isomerase-like protein (cupin superfamily)